MHILCSSCKWLMTTSIQIPARYDVATSKAWSLLSKNCPMCSGLWDTSVCRDCSSCVLNTPNWDKGGSIRRRLWYGTGIVSQLWCIWPNHANFGGSRTEYLCAPGWTFIRLEKGCCSFSSNRAIFSLRDFLRDYGILATTNPSTNCQSSNAYFYKCKM